MSAAAGTTLDPVFAAMQKFRRHEYDDCVAMCTELLAANPGLQEELLKNGYVQ